METLYFRCTGVSFRLGVGDISGDVAEVLVKIRPTYPRRIECNAAEDQLPTSWQLSLRSRVASYSDELTGRVGRLRRIVSKAAGSSHVIYLAEVGLYEPQFSRLLALASRGALPRNVELAVDGLESGDEHPRWTVEENGFHRIIDFGIELSHGAEPADDEGDEGESEA